MKQNFLNSVKVNAPKRNVFDLTHDVKGSCNMGWLVPVACTEMLPSDRFKVQPETLVRLAPMLAPMMHRVDVKYDHFFVPYRLLWDKWDEWIKPYPEGGIRPAAPYLTINSAGYDISELPDYLGLPKRPTDADADLTVDAKPFAAYQLIWNEYFRDQNLQPESLGMKLDDGDNTVNIGELVKMRKRCWEPDYFTKALPDPQAGAAVDIPLGDVTLKDNDLIPQLFAPSLDANVVATNVYSDVTGLGGVVGGNPTPVQFDPNGSLEVSPVTINTLRTAFRLQEWFEKANRVGKRITEVIRGFFNIRPSDARLQRPEYILGSKTPLVISEVLNMTGTDDAPQGTMAGHGVTYINSSTGSYEATEWGYYIVLMSVMPKTAYMQGIPKMFHKFTDPTQHFWPQFAHLGEQPVTNDEIYGWKINGKDPFAYQPIYSDYRILPNRVVGQFRTTLDFWHMARKFDEQPQFNGSFVESDPTKRVFAVTDPDTHAIFFQVYFKWWSLRPIPIYGSPTF